ncbi:uncharacterized protein FOMMEDRAFT_113814 [Fomitiporia mediterranea MF3/22]|uniref:uncharacterized protein n=1 Tax=Fomitiporia mediterranea (strain MF3/22) TaxID=694068 RepID=UPI00044079DD|nr:uncharacterized protein FOMMEDRAFT_113814 [Fomitiporia mediterranea MF3/22]EJC98650.1 hypothetical protein FOMMEDRAFT_113814 [Fomitiporia mediterranea MF3/22]
MGYISKHALQNLKQYQYKGVDKSILSRYVLNPFWNQLVKLWPKSVAPNTITLTGLSLVFINFLMLLYYDPYYLTAKHGVDMPRWIYFTWAAGLFMYQSLDAIDGKQARRTQMSGPLGEMFDHGCDAINTTLGAILTCYALNLGRSWWTIASQVASLANFYLTTWEEYHTGQLFLGVFSGPVEGILMIVGLFIVTGFYGPEFWDQGILSILHLGSLTNILPDVPLNIVFLYFGGVGLAFNIFTSYRNVHQRFLSSSSSKPSPSSFTPRGSQSSLIRPTLRLLPFPLAVSLQLLWLYAPTPKQSMILYSPLFVPFMCAWGLQFAHQVGRMILAHLTKRKDMPFWEWMWIWTVLCVVDANAETALGRPPIIQTTYTRTTLLVLTTLLLSFLTYARFVYVVINDITNFLGIACFTVRKKDSSGVWRSSIPESPTMEVDAQTNGNINAKGKVE